MSKNNGYILTQEYLEKLIKTYADEDVKTASEDVLSELIGKAFFDGDSAAGESFLYSVNNQGVEEREMIMYDD